MEKFSQFGINLEQNQYGERIVYGIALLYNVISAKVMTYLKPFDMSIGKLNILLVIKNRGLDEGIAQVEISKHLIVTPSNMTKMIDKLEQQLLVKRVERLGDRRVKLIQITSQGIAVLEELWPGYQQILEETAASLKEEDKKTLSGLLFELFDRLT